MGRDRQSGYEAESITFSFSDDVARFSFTANGFTGNPSGGNVGLIITVYYDVAKTVSETFNVQATEGSTVQVTD